MLLTIVLIACHLIGSSNAGLDVGYLSKLTAFAGDCDLLFLPTDQHKSLNNLTLYPNISNVQLKEIQMTKAVTFSSSLTTEIISRGHCPLAVLVTSSKNRLTDTTQVALGTRAIVSLAVITQSSKVQLQFQKASTRFTFDAALYMETEFGKYEEIKVLVAENKAWETVKISLRYSESWFQKKPGGGYYGMDYDILVELAKRQHLIYKYKEAANYVGMIQEVQNGTSDMAISQGSYNYNRYNKAGDVSIPYGVRDFHMATSKPGLMAAKWTIIYPFDKYTWVALAMSVICMALSLYILNYVEYLPREVKVDGYHIFAISIVTLISEAFPDEWMDIRKYSKVASLLLFVWFPTTILISSAYESTLLASLVSVQKEDAIDTWQELLDHNIMFSLSEGYLTTELMRDSKRDIVRQVYEECLVNRNGFYKGSRPDEHTEMLLTGKAAYLSSGNLVGNSHLYILGEQLEHTYTGMHYVKKFPWAEPLNQVIGRMVDSGVIAKLKNANNFDKDKPVREHERTIPKEEVPKLSMKHMAFTWIVTAVGVALATLSFKWEVTGGRLFRRNTTVTYSNGGLQTGRQRNHDRKLVRIAVDKAIKNKVLKYDTYLA